MKPYMMSLSEAAIAIQNDKLTPLELLASLLDRIDSVESYIHAWVTIDKDRVIKEAKIASKQEALSSLHGIPIGVKDIYYTAGIRTSMGSPIFKDFIPDSDAAIVKQIRAAGALVLGKTETTEFALHDPAPTTNPWNILHSPGGSSSGSAAAVATGMCPAAFGSQTGGSVIRPASYCGVVGFKPTYNLLSKANVYPLSWSLDHVGYMTRTVEDAFLLLRTLLMDNREWSLRKRPPKIGVLREYFKENAQPMVWDGYEKAVMKISGKGADITEITLPKSFKYVHDVHRVIMSVETAAVHEDLFKDKKSQYGEYIRGYICSGLSVPATAYLRAQRLRSIIINEMKTLLNDFDCLVCPSTVDTAPKGLEWTGSPAFNAPWSLTGFPSITIPIGLAENKLPTGLQLIGEPYGEWNLLKVSGWCEEKIDFQKRPIDPVISD
jgi:aspartyl-tRNA(Asn)/glutamyl-tRNA(Gln) amidotransferase subunit A